MNKVPVFVAGILLGVGATAVTWFVVADKKKDKPLIAGKSEMTVNPTKHRDTGKVEEAPDKPTRVKPDYYRPPSDSDYFPNIDGNSTLYDSLIKSVEPIENEVYGESEVIRKDKLVAVKKVFVDDRTPSAEQRKTDSVLQQANNVKEDQNGKFFEIEFWRSALNSRGYRMGRQKIALYGIDPEENIALFRLSEGLFLRSGSNLYRLDVSPEFRAFRQVTDQSIRKETGL